tara:strand:+ start:7309 stop:7929 length:621 start_codon:yes stop_codon:yes gene_type:complete
MRGILNIMSKLILCVETTTNICSVGLFKDSTSLVLKENYDKSHSSVLALFVEQIFQETKFNINELDAIAISVGPGSYTGLRIGISFVKGIAYSLNIPIIPIDTIDSLNTKITELNYLIAIHAYSDNYYLQEFKDKVKYGAPKFVSIDEIDKNKNIYGYNSKKEKFIEIIKPSAKKIAKLAFENYNKSIVKDIKLVKPNYINPIKFK